MSKIVAMISPPTPNGGLHLGHIAGPFLSGDVFTRTQRLLGHDVVCVSYSDDYQSYVRRKARELGEQEEKLCARYADEIDKTLERCGIAIDHFMRSRGNARFMNAVTTYVTMVQQKNLVRMEKRTVPYCSACDLLGYEAFARGSCNVCGNPSDASQCATCASAPDVTKMDGLLCTQCRRPTTWAEADCYVFDLGHYRSFLRDYYSSVEQRPQLVSFLKRNLAESDLQWPITRPGECGIPVSWEGGQIVSTWFSGLAGYRAAFEEYAERCGRPDCVQSYWHDSQAIFAHFLGFDCSYSHAIAYRALLATTESPPERVHYYTNAFLKLDGDDFSTSRGHAIWAKDILNDIKADTLRLYLASVAPEEAPRNFDSAMFNRWWPRFEAATASLEHHCVSRPDATEANVALLETLKARWCAHASIPRFSMRGLAETVLELFAVIEARCQEGRSIDLLRAGYAAMTLPLQPTLATRLIEQHELPTDRLLAWLRQPELRLRDALSHSAIAQPMEA